MIRFAVLALALGPWGLPARADTPCELCKPAFDGDLATVAAQAGRGAEINAVNQGKTPLDWALEKRNWDVVLWLLDHHATFVQDAGNAYDFALQDKRSDVVQSLIVHRFDVNPAPRPGTKDAPIPPLSSAIYYDLSDIDTPGRAVALLLEAGADPNRADGETPLEEACGRGPQLNQLLLAAGARPTPAALRRAIDAAAKAANGDEAFERDDAFKVLKLYLAYGARFDPNDRAMANSLPVVLARADPALVLALIDAGAPIDATTPISPPPAGEVKRIDPAAGEGKSALALAAQAGDFDRIKLLLRLGADPDSGEFVTNGVATNTLMPMAQALTRGDPRIVALLLDYGADMTRWISSNRTDYTGVQADANAALMANLELHFLDSQKYAEDFISRHPPVDGEANQLPKLAAGSVTPTEFREFLDHAGFTAGTRSQQMLAMIVARSLANTPVPSAEAVRHVALGAALASRARQRSDLAAAALQFEAALRLAPWVDDWRRDACMIESMASETGRAVFNCKMFAMAHPDDVEIKQRLEAVLAQAGGGHG